MSPLLRALVVIAVLYALGAFTMVVSAWLARWPRVKTAALELGRAATVFALGLMGLLLVVLLLRAFHLIPDR